MIIQITNFDIPMNRSEMNIYFNLDADIEIIISEQTVFMEEGIPIVEFAYFAKEWLDRNDETDFYYSSHDFEEESVLAFVCHGGIYRLESAFPDAFPSAGVPDLTRPELVSAIKEMLETLQRELDDKGISYRVI